MKEIWKDIHGYEGIYQVSNKGNIKMIKNTLVRKDGVVYNLPERQLKLTKNTKGYPTVQLSRNCNYKTIVVHRLVAKLFIQNKDLSKDQVNHIDGNKSNNNVNNLEWVDQTENINHSLYMGLRHTRKVRCIETGQVFISVREAARFMKSCHKDIINCCKIKHYTCKGHHFEYIN